MWQFENDKIWASYKNKAVIKEAFDDDLFVDGLEIEELDDSEVDYIQDLLSSGVDLEEIYSYHQDGYDKDQIAEDFEIEDIEAIEAAIKYVENSRIKDALEYRGNFNKLVGKDPHEIDALNNDDTPVLHTDKSGEEKLRDKLEDEPEPRVDPRRGSSTPDWASKPHGRVESAFKNVDPNKKNI